MKIFPILLIIFWITVIVFPDFLNYLIGWFFIVVWINMLWFSMMFSSKMKKGQDEYIKFGKYKIYR